MSKSTGRAHLQMSTIMAFLIQGSISGGQTGSTRHTVTVLSLGRWSREWAVRKFPSMSSGFLNQHFSGMPHLDSFAHFDVPCTSHARLVAVQSAETTL